MTDHCQPNKDPAGNRAEFGMMDPENLFGASGWCRAAAPQITCTCLLDGVGGPNCDIRHESFCPNQCNGHGDCNLGFCQCHEGWWGQDCANRRAGVPLTPGALLDHGGRGVESLQRSALLATNQPPPSPPLLQAWRTGLRRG